MKTAEQHKGRLQVVGVTDSSIDDTLRFLDEHELPFAILAGAGPVRKEWQVGVIWGSPSYLVNKDGLIVAEEVLSLSGGELAALLGR